MVQYKLYYFFSRGLGEVARQLLFLGDIEYEDIRFTKEQWIDAKKNFTFDQVPVLEVDGVPIPQSLAIYRFLAKITGHCGKDDIEQAIVDALADQHKDFYVATLPYFLAGLGIFPESEEYVKAKYEQLVVPNRPNYLNYLTKFLRKSKTGFLAGGDLTFVDLMVAEYVTSIRAAIPDFTAGYPEVEAHVEKVISIPKLKQWLDKRPVTPF